jgi:hypothetical protein
MEAQQNAASLSASFDFAKWGADEGFTDDEEDDFLCSCGKMHPPTFHQQLRFSEVSEGPALAPTRSVTPPVTALATT